MMEGDSVPTELQDGPARDEDTGVSQLLGAWDMSGPPNTDDFLQGVGELLTTNTGAPDVAREVQGDPQGTEALSSTDALAPQNRLPQPREDLVAAESQWVEQEAPLIPEKGNREATPSLGRNLRPRL